MISFSTPKGENDLAKENYAFGVALDYLKVICIITGFCLSRVEGAGCLFPAWSHNLVCDLAIISTATNSSSTNQGLQRGSTLNKQVLQVEQINFPKIKICCCCCCWSSVLTLKYKHPVENIRFIMVLISQQLSPPEAHRERLTWIVVTNLLRQVTSVVLTCRDLAHKNS